MKIKNVLWLTHFPYEYVKEKKNSGSHPVPWVTVLSEDISKRVNLTIVAWSRKVIGIEKFRKNGINFVFIECPKLRYDLLALYTIRIKQLKKILHDFSDIDIIHVHGTEHQYEIAAMYTGIPYVISVQGVITLYRPFYPRKFSAVYISWILSSLYERFGIRKGKYFICRTKWDSQFIKKINPNAKIFINSEPIRENFFIDNYDYESKNIIFLGGTYELKGQKETLRCINILKQRGYNYNLMICGVGNSKDLIRNLSRLNLSINLEAINFLGFQNANQLAKLFKKSFCMLHPSHIDNSPNSICEAQASGLPVIATDVGGVSSLIRHGVTGLLVNRYDYIGLADQVCKLKNDKNLYHKISENSKIIARHRHSRNAIANKTLNIYEEVIKNEFVNQ